jgi:predicted transcriptional regulator of viral defense system
VNPLSHLTQTLKLLANAEHYLFTLNDLHSIFPQTSQAALRMLLGRAVKAGLLQRVCQGLYLYPAAYQADGLLLYRAATRLRASEFNYLSLESVLSDAGIISQLPMAWITLMSSGRNRIVDCGQWGRIEFIHTKRTATSLVEQVMWDNRLQLWRASVNLALQDMRYTRRNMDLVDWEIVNELVG